MIKHTFWVKLHRLRKDNRKHGTQPSPGELNACGYKADDLVLVDDQLTTGEQYGAPVRRSEDVSGGWYVVTIADPESRRNFRIARTPAVGAHDEVLLSGCVALANAFVSTRVQLGAHAEVQHNATVGHDSPSHDFVTDIVQGTIAGSSTPHSDVAVGSNAAVPPGLRRSPRPVTSRSPQSIH